MELDQNGGSQEGMSGMDVNDPMCESGDGIDKKEKKGGWPKGKKRKKVKDENAPKQPLSGYVRFLNNRREKVRQENSHLSFADVTKLLGAEWTKLPQQEKQRYLDEAVKDRERYQRELEAYHQTESYKLFRQKMEHKKSSQGEMGGQQGGANDGDTGVTGLGLTGGADDIPTFDIPIFTEEFLKHNKDRETELRQLRKQNTEYEEENAILGKHIDNMKSAISKLETESIQQRNTNQALQQHLDKLRAALASSFSGLTLPGGASEPATVENIDTYMAKLHSLIVESPKEHERLIASAREVLSRINFDNLDKA